MWPARPPATLHQVLPLLELQGAPLLTQPHRLRVHVEPAAQPWLGLTQRRLQVRVLAQPLLEGEGLVPLRVGQYDLVQQRIEAVG